MKSSVNNPTTSLLIALTIVILIVSCKNSNVKKEPVKWPVGITAPKAIKKEKALTAHGDTRIDEYYWMNDYFKKGPDSSLVVDYLKAENAYLDTMLSPVKTFRESLFKEMKSRIQEKDESAPAFNNGYFYYSRTEEGKQYFKYCRKKGSLDAPEEVLLDVDKLAEGHGYFEITGFSVSPDNKLLAYSEDRLSRRQYTIKIKNLETGQTLSDSISNTEGDAVWAADSKIFFYITKNPITLLSEKIMRHQLGTSPNSDAVVYTEKDPSNYIYVSKTKSKDYICIISAGTLSCEYRILKANNPLGTFSVFQPRLKNVLYFIDHWNDRFLIRTNKDAENFRLLETPIDKTGIENWNEVIPHRSDVLLEEVELFRDYWVIVERKEGLLQLRIHNVRTNNDYYLPFDEPSYTASTNSNFEFGSNMLRYSYTSLTTPKSEYDYDMNGRSKKLLKEQSVLGNFKKSNYVTERIYATAADGVKVPISIVYKKTTKIDGSAPLLLYAYGSYGASIDASFSSFRLSLLDRGFIYAIAHVRGGQEMGRKWYEDGKLLKKKNTFTDFIKCGEELIAKKYTSRGHLYANGGSAGGLLMGAVYQLAPNLWNGIVANVPFVDVVTTMSDPTIPLTTNEYDEWGNPANKAEYKYMKSYSPYDNVEKKAYPHLLVTTGLHDSQVQYFEPAKWVARLRANKTDNNLLLLYTNMEGGHGGSSGRFDYLKEVALRYAFFMALEGITK